MNEVGALYGREGEYFANLPDGDKNFIWIELIGFDNEAADFKVGNFIGNMGFKPYGVSFLVTSIDFVNLHRGVGDDVPLSKYCCSYAGHAANDERKRQKWTAGQLKKLISELHKYGIKVYFSLFDFSDPEGSFIDEHPELGMVKYEDAGRVKTRLFYMTKRFSDGRYYEDFFLDKLLSVLKDYEFDGVHLADGVVRPRCSLQTADYSEDMFSQLGFDTKNITAEYILENYRYEWIIRNSKRWMSYLEKVITGVNKNGFSVIANSSWTKDPMEALYRYGSDYKALSTLPIEALIVENGAPNFAIIDTRANAGYRQTYDERKMLHYTFRSTLMCIAAQMGDMCISPLYPVRDTTEQYDVIHTVPTSLQRHSAAMFSSFVLKKDEPECVISGNTYCLGDGLSRDDWRFLRLCSDNAYVARPKEVKGATLIWSDKRNENEVKAFVEYRTPSTVFLHSALLKMGAAIHKIAHIDDIDYVNGDIVVTNPELMPENERMKIQKYNKGQVFLISGEKEHGFEKKANPEKEGFPYPLHFAGYDKNKMKETVKEINKGLCFIEDDDGSCRVQEIVTDDNHSRFIVENEEYFICVPRICTGRIIKSAKAVNLQKDYNVRFGSDTFEIIVQLRGSTIVEIEFM